jgi:hypothetical protein
MQSSKVENQLPLDLLLPNARSLTHLKTKKPSLKLVLPNHDPLKLLEEDVEEEEDPKGTAMTLLHLTTWKKTLLRKRTNGSRGRPPQSSMAIEVKLSPF